MKTCTLMTVAALVSAETLWAEPIAVQTRSRGFVNVEERTTVTQSGVLSVEPEAKIYKGGEGQLDLPASQFDSTADVSFDVLAGKVRLYDDGTTDTPVKPVDVLNQSVFWVDETSVVGGEGGVTRWNDVRDGTGDTHTREFAAPVWDPSVGSSALPTVVTANGHSGVNFGGVGSGVAMQWKNTEGGDGEIGGIRRLFIVCSADTGWVNPVQSFFDTQLQGQYHDGRFNQALHTPQTNEAKTPHEDTVIFVNGRRVDPCGTLISEFGDGGRGLFLLEYAFYGVNGAQLGDFYSDRQVGVADRPPSRFGGDTLHEMISFQSILSESDAASVRRYLLSKYGLAKSVRNIGVAEGAVLEVAAGEESPTTDAAGVRSRVMLSGDGDVVKSGSGKAVLGVSAESPFLGVAHIEEGTLIQRGPVAVAVASGTKVESVGYDSTHIERGKLGDEITLSATAPAGSVVKTGDGAVTVAGLPADVKVLSVEAGTVALRAPAAAPSLEHATTPSIFVTNHSFEDNRGDSDVWHGASDLPLTIDGWTFGGDGWCDACGFFNNTLLQHGWLSNELHAPDGNWAAFFKGRFWMDTTVTIDERGRYEISLRAKNRHENGGGGNPKEESGLEVFIGPDADHLTSVGHCFPDVHMYQRYRLKTGVLEPGTYVLRIDDSMRDWIDHAQTIDDVRVTRIPERGESGVWALPNGDFEQAGTKYQGVAGAYMALRDPTINVVSLWTIDPGSSTPAENGFAAIQPIPVGFYDNLDTHEDACHRISGYMDAGYGSVQLSFWGENSGNTATISQTFRPPAGTWRLRCRSRSYRGLGASRGWNKEDGALVATIAPAGGENQDLGTVVATGVRFAQKSWPTAFTTDGETDVTLTLRQSNEHGCAIVDDFELVPAKSVELIRNGGLEGWAEWDSYVPQGGFLEPLEYANDVTRDHFTTDRHEGRYCMRVNQNGGIQQTVTIPETGLYRLSYWAQSRHGYGNDHYFNWNGRNPIRVFLLRDGVPVQTLDDTPVESTNFVEHVVLARIEAGTYNLVFQGQRAEPASEGVESGDHATLLDDISLRGVAADEMAQAPELDKTLRIRVAEGAKLRLDFDGVIRVGGVKYAGASRGGIVSAETCPDFVLGPGKLNVVPVGFTVVIR